MKQLKDISEFTREELEAAVYSAQYILEDSNPEKLEESTGLPMGVIVAALENILKEK